MKPRTGEIRAVGRGVALMAPAAAQGLKVGGRGGEERHRRETNEQHNIVDKGHKKKEKDEFNYLTIQTRATISCNTTITHI